MQRRIIRLGRAIAAVAVITFVAAPHALASLSFDNMMPTATMQGSCADDASFSNPKIICQTDNASWTLWSENSVSARDWNTIRNVIETQFRNTDLTPIYASSPTYTGESETDLIYQVSSTGWSSNQIGRAWCDDAVIDYRCDQYYVRFRTGWVDSENACHESGHAVGLMHGSNAYPRVADDNAYLFCMETPNSGNRPTLGSHNTKEINETY
jgi:hypothetical protein